MTVRLDSHTLPPRLRALGIPLWFSRPPDFSRPRVGVVGSRLADPNALEFTNRFAGELAEAGMDVVSGGALGIDDAAHGGCLGAGGFTWLVSPVGFNHVSPPEQRERFDEVRDRGILVSRRPPAADKARGNHLLRNEVIVALSDVLVVVRAARKSGTYQAGAGALASRAPCLVLPGALGDPGYEGCRLLAQRGARFIHDEAELWSAIQLATTRITKPELGSAADALLTHLDRTPRHVDWLAEVSGLDMAELVPALLTLSLKDVVREGPAGFWAIGSNA